MNGIWRFNNFLPEIKDDNRVTLGEGNTPLIKSNQLGKELGLKNLYFKLENTNPSGSYKDRFAALAISDLLQRGSDICLATSSGNAGSSLAAYSAAVGIKCFICIVDGTPLEKRRQMQIYGTEPLMIEGFCLDTETTENVMNNLNSIAHNMDIPVHISAYHYSPIAMEGVQTIAFEIAEDIPFFNGHIFSPVGGGGLALSIIKGFEKWKDIYPQFKTPKVHCVQPKGNDTIATPLREGGGNADEVVKSNTSISGLQVPNIIDGDKLIKACNFVGGTGYSVSDKEIFDCQKHLTKKEGIFSEPAGAVSLAGVIHALEKGEIDENSDVVCIISGHGFKDSPSASKILESSGDEYFHDYNKAFDYIRERL